MDCVPRRHRGKVNAVDSVRTFSWSGSAALGGFLIERFGEGLLLRPLLAPSGGARCQFFARTVSNSV